MSTKPRSADLQKTCKKDLKIFQKSSEGLKKAMEIYFDKIGQIEEAGPSIKPKKKAIKKSADSKPKRKPKAAPKAAPKALALVSSTKPSSRTDF